MNVKPKYSIYDFKQNFKYFIVLQICCEQALAAFESRLEMDELAVYQREMEAIIQKPLCAYTWVVY